MKRILILVEGQTEETFVREVLAPHLVSLGLALQPVIVVTSRLETGEKNKGGIIRFGPVKQNLLMLLGDSNAVKVTTLFDFYGLPRDFPGMAPSWRGTATSASLMQSVLSAPQ
ncbi:DUF4276 family protein [Hyalangium versicolor]|uniref:DUF4276 family protein n=1 Tax=Hyalangium versicolor TaxID=2861190 RepID=UPI0021052D5E|nr:DUF4276 family protein [Hyalangium versicolor]